MNESREQLIIQNFFRRIKVELGYSPDLDKYFDFLTVLLSSELPDELAQRKERIYRIARFLFCEKERDEPRFQQIFDRVFEQERMALDRIFVPLKDTSGPTVTTSPGAAGGQKEESSEEIALDEEGDNRSVHKPWETVPSDKYLNFSLSLSTPAGTAFQQQEAASYEDEFVYSNDYHIISFREMIQSWRYFRLHQPMGFSNEPDIPAIIDQVARDGMFTELKFKRAYANREDALLILADRRGSMTPFHSLVDNLLQTARLEGGHHKAQVFYFQNYPLNFVYRTPFFTQPVSLKEVLSNVSLEHTYVLIISDAGAAKGNLSSGRIEATGIIQAKDKDGRPVTNEKGQPVYELDESSFLGKLLRSTKDLVWLNPMPRDRWEGTSAGIIAHTPKVKMHSLHDSNRLGFTFAIKDLLYEG